MPCQAEWAIALRGRDFVCWGSRFIADADPHHLVRDCCFDFVTLPCPDAVQDTVIGTVDAVL